MIHYLTLIYKDNESLILKIRDEDSDWLYSQIEFVLDKIIEEKNDDNLELVIPFFDCLEKMKKAQYLGSLEIILNVFQLMNSIYLNKK